MITPLLTFINVFLLFIGIYSILKEVAIGDSKPLLLLTSGVILFIAISFFYYIMLVLNQSFIGLQLFLFAINLGHIYFTKKSFTDLFKSKLSSTGNLNNLWALGAVFFLTGYFVLYASKYGSWDAWAMWNMHAKFLYHPELWKQLFTSNLTYSSLDYPLMLPSVVAFFWNSLHATSPIVPLLFSYGTMLVIPLFIFYALQQEKLNLLSCIALAIFVIDVNYRSIATSQCADSLLSLLILLVFVQYSNLKNNNSNRVYLLGFICASCAWVKNEGLVFYLLFTLVFVLTNYKNTVILKKYLAAIIIPTIVLVSFKLFYAPVNALISENNKQLSSLSLIFLNKGRYLIIIKAWLNMLVSNYMCGVIMVFSVFILNRKFFISLPMIVISLLLLAYFVIYLIAPNGLEWNLYTSLYRILQHIYPALIYLLLLSLRNVKLSGSYIVHDSPGQ